MKKFLEKLAGTLATLMLVFCLMGWVTILPTLGVLWLFGII